MMPLYSFMFCAGFSRSYVTLFEFNVLLFSETKNCFALYIPIIQRYMHPGTTIYSDQWPANNLNIIIPQ